jgi:hypothetical protein
MLFAMVGPMDAINPPLVTPEPSRLIKTTVSGTTDYSRPSDGDSSLKAISNRHPFTFPTPDRSAVEFAQVVFEFALQYLQANTILVMNNFEHPSAQIVDGPSSVQRSAAGFGADSAFTTRPSMEAGSTKLKSKSASFRDNASAKEEFLTSTCCGGKLAPGIAG